MPDRNVHSILLPRIFCVIEVIRRSAWIMILVHPPF
jgi:hypothetical protein